MGIRELRVRDRSGNPISFDVHSCNTLVVGAGTAGLKCALRLFELGVREVAICVDRLGAGTSNNSGSDKQTYYKMGVLGDESDSPMDFARSLFEGGMMHGDLAYIEAVGSLPAFYDLCRIGVPFPCNRYGAYVGYKTDHDPRQRATSAGPKTSRFMFRELLGEVQRRGIPIFDRHQAVKLLAIEEGGEGSRVVGVVCLRRGWQHRANLGLMLFNARNVVLATGGPGEMYKASVWPHGQVGSHGLALEIGVVANNLTELQYGLASTAFRWNLSGTYQQVVPDYFSTGPDGESDRRYFLHEHFPDMGTLATNIFRKGYQWPFHAERLRNHGSSLVDLAVQQEVAKRRRVFLDFSRNPTPAAGMRPFSLAELHPEVRQYLLRSGATRETPYERLAQMNPASIEVYAEHGIDLRLPLEAAVCAQHCNGGLRGSAWWETSVRNLFAIGEINGTHGVRPGGSALNSGQVGAARAAQRIANRYDLPPRSPARFADLVERSVAELHAELRGFLNDASGVALASIRPDIQARMSASAGFLRSPSEVKKALFSARELYRRIFRDGIRCPQPRQLARAVEDRSLALTSVAFLTALDYYIENGGGSRGSYVILDPDGDREIALGASSDVLRYRSENRALRDEILEIRLRPEAQCEFSVYPVPVRPLPADESWFETTWAAHRRGEVYD